MVHHQVPQLHLQPPAQATENPGNQVPEEHTPESGLLPALTTAIAPPTWRILRIIHHLLHLDQVQPRDRKYIMQFIPKIVSSDFRSYLLN